MRFVLMFQSNQPAHIIIMVDAGLLYLPDCLYRDGDTLLALSLWHIDGSKGIAEIQPMLCYRQIDNCLHSCEDTPN